MELDDIAYVPTTGVRRTHETPLVVATDTSLEGYGKLVDDPKTFAIEIVRWPQQGWRPVDANSGDQGGITQGVFEFQWMGETLFARNNAVRDSYLFGWSTWPEEASLRRPQAPHVPARSSGGRITIPTAGSSSIP